MTISVAQLSAGWRSKAHLDDVEMMQVTKDISMDVRVESNDARLYHVQVSGHSV